MLMLLAFSLMAAYGTMAYRRHLRGPWYKYLLPRGAGVAHWSAAAKLPLNAATFTWHNKQHVHRIWMTFFKVSRSAVAGNHSNDQADSFVAHLFPASRGWLKPRMAVETVFGVRMLLWQGYRRSTAPSTAPHSAPRITAFRYLLVKASGGGRLKAFLFGADHAPQRIDNEIFLQMADRMAAGEP